MIYNFNKVCASDRLAKEIQESDITVAFNYIETTASSTIVHFKAALSESQETTLGTIVTNHVATALPENTVLKVKNSAFADKAALFFRGKGIKQTIEANTTENIIYTMLYPKGKINGVEILYGNDGDICNFKVLDSTTGSYTTVPNYLLNQFGFSWNVKSNGTKEILPYDADLYYGMQLVVEYTNNTDSNTEIAVNFYIHEDKS